MSTCRFVLHWRTKFCLPEGVFQEWIDRKWIRRWKQILTNIDDLTQVERRQMHKQASSEGLLEIYRQILLFSWIPNVNKFRMELENHYGHDISARKGNEIIFTTRQLLNSPGTCQQSLNNTNLFF